MMQLNDLIFYFTMVVLMIGVTHIDTQPHRNII